jgi:hydroxymethylbilane synthase
MDGFYDAAVLAAAGLIRIGLDASISEWFSTDVMLPAPGQAALAVQCRADDADTRALLVAINDPAAEAATLAERAFLHALGGGCSIPVAAYACVLPDGGTLHLSGAVMSVDGTQRVEVAGKGTDASELGSTLAHQALGRGAANILRRHE